MRRKLLLLPVLAGGMVGLAVAQPPGGGFGGFPGGGGPGGFGGKGGEGRMKFGGGPPDPEMIWGMVSKGQPYVDLNDPANAGTKQRMISQGQAIPADGKLTKEAFTANFQASMAKRMAGGGAPGGPPMMFQAGGTPGGPGGFGGGPGGFGGGRGGPGGGFDPSAMTDDQVRDMMRRMDADGDGRISLAEALQSSRFTAETFAQYDTNKDGFIDVAEYRVYMTARFQQRQQDGGGPGQFPQPGMPSPFTPPGGPTPPGTTPPVPGQPTGPTEDPRPEVFRYGKLPKEAPSWMMAPSSSNRDGLDADRDGQIGLYEWRKGGRKTADFVAMDLNGDGYVTFQEWKTYTTRLIEQQKADDPDGPPAMPTFTPGGPSGGGGGGGDRGGKGGDRKGPKGEGKGQKGEGKGAKGGKGGGNPFNSGE